MKRLLAAALLLSATGAQATGDPHEWTQPTAPFHIVGNLYYVGSKGLAAYLITSPKGAILLDGTMARNVPAIEANIRSLGFRLSDVKVLLNSHAHFDHAGGLAACRRDTGAVLEAMAGDVPALEQGRHFGLTSYPRETFPAVHVDHVLRDKEVVTLDDVRMTAIATPGHTRGCTTWVLPVKVEARTETVVFPCSITVAGNRLVGNTEYPGIVADFRRSFDRLDTVNADIVLTAHPEASRVMERRGTDFLTPGLLQKMVAEARAAFAVELARQEGAARR